MRVRSITRGPHVRARDEVGDGGAGVIIVFFVIDFIVFVGK
jgi:hypothetical protein